MTYNEGKCGANCGFCPQARTSHGKAELLSRISWPIFPTEEVLNGIGKPRTGTELRRICIQALNYPRVFSDLVALVRAIKRCAEVPVSVSCQPLKEGNIRDLAAAGVSRIGIPLDAATPKLFNEVKGSAVGGSYKWEDQFMRLREAVKIVGKGNVSTHLIVGLGETEKEALNIIQKCVDMTVLPALFAFTPIRGTALEMKPQPNVAAYRRLQLARHLIVKGMARYRDMRFDFDGKVIDFGVDGEKLKLVVESGEPFLTSGCPGCNRPFYNEKPSGPLFNYPRKIRSHELTIIKQDLNLERV
jgi:biotin synthase